MSDLRRRVPRAHLQRHHRYDFHMFVHVRRGECRAVVDFSHIECGAGSLLTIRPGQVHRFGPGSRWDANLLLFRPELLQASQGDERLQMPELIDALPGHLRLDRSTGRFVADTLARMEQECALDARQPRRDNSASVRGRRGERTTRPAFGPGLQQPLLPHDRHRRRRGSGDRRPRRARSHAPRDRSFAVAQNARRRISRRMCVS